MEINLLECVKAIPSCPDLRVGDRLFKVGHEFRPGGYEYVVCRRISDDARIAFRIDHLGDCFEVVEQEVDITEEWTKRHIWWGRNLGL